MHFPAIAAVLISLVLAVPAQADLICPKGALAEFNFENTWQQYEKSSSDYLTMWHKRMMRRMQEAITAQTAPLQALAGRATGEDTALLMKRMFEQGFIAASDILNAYCVRGPDAQPWSVEIREDRRRAWCGQWGDAHFCR